MTIGVTEARQRFREIVDEVQYSGHRVVVERHGRPVAAIVPLEVYQAWKDQRAPLINLIERVQAANPEAEPDEVMRDVLVAQSATRERPPKRD